ncbi:MAG: hypothetical protein NWQ31_12250 [Polaribacter sp.]|nr:hypothetical protein [Polaribacter sp.]
MKQFLLFFLVAIFAIFIGSQITEGVLLVPYWQSLSASDFYVYYNQFGKIIGQYFTVLTIISALIPVFVAVYCMFVNYKALKFALISTFFAILFITSFYVYFKGVNELFFAAAFNETELKNELIIWSYWHWGRIVLECLSLIFLILAFIKIQKTNFN